MSELQPGDDAPLLGNTSLAWAAGLAVFMFACLLGFVPPLIAGFTAYLFLTMALITLTDLRHFIVPDLLSLPSIPVGLLASTLVMHDSDWQMGLLEGITGAAIGGGVFFALRRVYFHLRGVEGLGLGDVKLAAVAGAWLGPATLAPACLAAALSAIAVILLQAILGGKQLVHARLRVPFGSFIAPTIFVFWLAQILGYVPIW